MFEATRATQEGKHFIKFGNPLAMVLKLDLSKAYDRVSWLYLRLMLLHVGLNLLVVN
jgi:hypothetical protein